MYRIGCKVNFKLIQYKKNLSNTAMSYLDDVFILTVPIKYHKRCLIHNLKRTVFSIILPQVVY